MSKRGMRLRLFMWWNIRGHEMYTVQFTALHCRARQGYVSAVHRIESTAKESNVHVVLIPLSF